VRAEMIMPTDFQKLKGLWVYKKDTLLLIVVFTQDKISEIRHPSF